MASQAFLDAFAPYLSGDSFSGGLDEQIQPDLPTPAMGGISALTAPAPGIQTKRTIGNVLHDLFTDHIDANGVPVSEKIARLGDAFINAARNWRGQNPVDDVTPLRNARLTNAQWQQQQADLARQGQARNAFAELLTNPTPEGLAALAHAAPELASGYMQQRQTAQHQQAQEEHQNRVDEFNMSKPISLGGNSYATPKATGGFDITQVPLPPGFVSFTDGSGQAYIMNKTSGKSMPIGSPKPGVNKVVTVQGANGSELRMIDAQGNTVRTIGAAPPKGKQADKPGSSSEVMGLLDNIQQGFNSLHQMKALPGEGSLIDALGRTSIGQAVGEQMGGKAAQKRLEINKNISNLQQQMLKSLPASATRTRFEQEMLQRGLPDPMKMSYATAQTVIKQLRESYTRAVNELQSGGASTGGITPEQARAELARRQQGR